MPGQFENTEAAREAKPARRRFLPAFWMAVCAAALVAPALDSPFPPVQAAVTCRPNVVIVFADQLRAQALGSAGNPVVHTPRLDELANEGVRFTRSVCTQPVCTPSRAALLTGRFPHNTTVERNGDLLPTEARTIAEVLGDEGYATGFIGKWHLNGGTRSFRGRKNSPEARGFVPLGDSRQGFDFWAAKETGHVYCRARYFMDTPETIEVERYAPEVETDLAIDFIQRNREQPFCLVMAWGPPHDPYVPPAEWDTYTPGQIEPRPNVPNRLRGWTRKATARYYGLVSSLDHQMGRLLDALDAAGLAEDTIVVFTSDHGDMLGSHGHELKQKPWRESLEVPLLLRFGRDVPGGTPLDVPVSTVDVTPTVLGLCGVEGPADMDGVDLSPLLRGEGGEEPDSVFVMNSGKGRNGLGAEWRGVVTKQHAYFQTRRGGWLLYDHDADPYELTNLLEVEANVALRDQLSDRLARWRTETGDDRPLKGKLRKRKIRKLSKRLQRPPACK